MKYSIRPVFTDLDGNKKFGMPSINDLKLDLTTASNQVFTDFLRIDKIANEYRIIVKEDNDETKFELDVVRHGNDWVSPQSLKGQPVLVSLSICLDAMLPKPEGQTSGLRRGVPSMVGIRDSRKNPEDRYKPSLDLDVPRNVNRKGVSLRSGVPSMPPDIDIRKVRNRERAEVMKFMSVLDRDQVFNKAGKTWFDSWKIEPDHIKRMRDAPNFKAMQRIATDALKDGQPKNREHRIHKLYQAIAAAPNIQKATEAMQSIRTEYEAAQTNSQPSLDSPSTRGPK